MQWSARSGPDHAGIRSVWVPVFQGSAAPWSQQGGRRTGPGQRSESKLPPVLIYKAQIAILFIAIGDKHLLGTTGINHFAHQAVRCSAHCRLARAIDHDKSDLT